MEYVIKANGLGVTYGRDEPVITDASMTIRAQEFVFITGKSGSGKSTIIKSLYGELLPNRGDLNVCGVDFKNISTSKLNVLRRYLGVVFQDYKLIDEWTVEQNVMLPLIIGGFSKSVCVKQAHKLLKHVKLLHKINKYPYELSGGEQQRVAVARALINKPAVIFADEPSGNLDTHTAENLHELFFKLRDEFGQTFVIVTHNEELANMADRKLTMVDGNIVSS